MIACLFLVAQSRAEIFPPQSAQAIWKSADYGYVKYENCELRTNLDFEGSFLNLHRIAVQCDGAQEGSWPFSQAIVNYNFQIDDHGSVLLGNLIVGSFKNKIFQATFRSEREENVFIKVRFFENQKLTIVVSVDAAEFPSFEFWSKSN